MTLSVLARPQRARRIACAEASEERDQDREQHHSQFIPVTLAVSSSSCVEIMITAADSVVMPGIFWAAPCMRSDRARASTEEPDEQSHQQQRHNRADNAQLRTEQRQRVPRVLIELLNDF